MAIQKGDGVLPHAEDLSLEGALQNVQVGDVLRCGVMFHTGLPAIVDHLRIAGNRLVFSVLGLDDNI